MMFFKSHETKKREYNKHRYPFDWPSHLHNKCNQSSCKYPNPPQAAEGIYSCGGTKGPKPCNGTYIVSQGSAAEVMNMYRNAVRAEERARYNAERAALELAQQNSTANDKLIHAAAHTTPKSTAVIGCSAPGPNLKELPQIPLDPSGVASLGRRDAQRPKIRRPRPLAMPPTTSLQDNSYATGSNFQWSRPAQLAVHEGESWYRPRPVPRGPTINPRF